MLANGYHPSTKFVIVETRTIRQSTLLLLLLGLVIAGDLFFVVLSHIAEVDAMKEEKALCFSFSAADRAYLVDLESLSGGCSLSAQMRQPEMSVFFFLPLPVNKATVELLTTIRGIGEVTARNIIAWRETHGPIQSVNDLSQIPGIGPQKVRFLATQLDFESR